MLSNLVWWAISLAVLVTFKETRGVEVGEIRTIFHDVSGTLHVINSTTLFIDNFNFDGAGRRVLLYSYAPGQDVDRFGGGDTIPVPQGQGNSDGSLQLRLFNDEDIILPLPSGMTACDIATLTVWCAPFFVFFGRINIPRDIFVNDGADPCTVIGATNIIPTEPPEFDNCIPLHETLQLSWRVDNDNSNVRFRLCGCQSIDTNTNQYMGFGLSGSTDSTLMFGADPTIAWFDDIDGPLAVDYYLSAYTQCRAGLGACPDEMDSSGTCTNDISDITGSITNGQQCVSFTRQFSTSDSTCDITIDPDNTDQYIVWGIGGLGETAFKHFDRAEADDDPIHLGRAAQDQCSDVQLVCGGCMPFENESIIAREDTTFQARIGPSGNERGYMAITGRAGWGIAWYIDGILIPQLVVERSKTYTFIIEGGTDSNDLGNYHPFYITDSINGGRLLNNEEEREAEIVYAGFDENDQPTGVGRLCELRETTASETSRQSCNDLQTYISTLETTASCNSGEPGTLVWTPDENTPDLVYYQCATHLNLGWKIRVVDGESIDDGALPDDDDGDDDDGDDDDDDDGNDDGALLDYDDGTLPLAASLTTAIFMAIVAVLFAA